MNKIDKIVQNIKQWNKEDINKLKNLIDELDVAVNDLNNEQQALGYTGHAVSDFIDFTSLPSVKIPAHTSYPIWAMDQNGMCLVGESGFSIESYADIEEFYATK